MPAASARRPRLGVALLGLVAACAAERPLPRRESARIAPSASVPAPAASVSASRDADAAGPAAPEPLASRPLDPAALERLVADARATGTDDLVVIKDERLVGDWNFSGRRVPIQTMSLTKSVLSLLVGCLIDEGKLKLDQPVHELYPEWKDGDKRGIQLVHLLSHSSGLEEGKTARDIYASRDFVAFTLRAKLRFEPGTHYEYSNRAANLVSAIVARAAGVPTDRYAARVLFEPLGIERYEWARDRAGNVQGLAGLKLLARDVAKLGELVLARGAYRGRRVLSAEWIDRSTGVPVAVQPTNKRLALSWWLIPEWTRVTIDEGVVAAWRGGGTDPAFLTKAAPLIGRTFTSAPAFVAALRGVFGDPKLTEWAAATYERGLPDARFEFGPIVGSYSSGTLGQYLVVVPRDRLIVVRLRRGPPSASEHDEIEKSFPDFVDRARTLVQAR